MSPKMEPYPEEVLFLHTEDLKHLDFSVLVLMS